RIANYDIEVKLEPETRMLYGSERLHWFNKSADWVPELRFHLYLNAFRNNKSTFMRESGGRSRGFRLDKDGWGFIEVNSITLPGGQDLTGRMEYIQPDDGNKDDKTVFRLPLPEPVPPGGSIVVNIRFTGKLPSPPFARSGAKKEYFFVGQWFPKIGVWENGAWNCHQYHANSEFYADFGVYNVHITVPKENIVGATGLEVSVTDNGDGTATHFYHAEDVHDFAWTTSPEFLVFNERVQDVDVRLLLQPDHRGQAERHLEAARQAIEHFQNWYGDYPFPNLTIVDPRRGAGGSGGMEYPTLITAGTVYGLPGGIRLVEDVIIHEFGHNYWYHMLASNEFEESWMDEGINTYTEIQIMNDAYGPIGDMVDYRGVKVNDLEAQRFQYLMLPDADPVLRYAWKFYNSTSYGVNSYSKPGLFLTTLKNYLGQETMRKVMREYVRRWRFKHPHTRDFIQVVNDVSGQDLNWFFRQALFTNAVLDYSVDRLIVAKVKKGEGYDFTLSVADTSDSAGASSTDTAAAVSDSAAQDQDSLASASEDTSQTPKLYRNEVWVRRLGQFVFPVEVEIVFDSGDTLREQWDGRELWKKFRYIRPDKLVYATVDPDRKIPLDINFTNNSRTLKRQRKGVNKLALRWMFWAQFFVDQPEFVNFLNGFLRLPGF
ncbi:MAG TPA: M1 family peptidase, partial [Bacteroidetes bacterium]|nr:M1 family peptidase [Bacteroidota bacterium]